ncbi:hypothetical protein BGX16_2580 [Hallerella succinigenes]|uniref:Uncharacterized protein n=1 Tax=Hallerella succinigenes TaxID=1896222 RepID=A0A2M9AA38_9BACT|nr:hypothetical protein BGX16_2580 [Hallerella succinigenes]
MAKKKYDRGMNNFKIEQLEPRQMFSADVGLNDIEQQLENIPDIVENTLESIDNLQMSNLGLDATLNSASAILPDIATDIQSLISSTFANYKNSLPPNTESISLDTLAAELNSRPLKSQFTSAGQERSHFLFIPFHRRQKPYSHSNRTKKRLMALLKLNAAAASFALSMSPKIPL